MYGFRTDVHFPEGFWDSSALRYFVGVNCLPVILVVLFVDRPLLCITMGGLWRTWSWLCCWSVCFASSIWLLLFSVCAWALTLVSPTASFLFTFHWLMRWAFRFLVEGEGYRAVRCPGGRREVQSRPVSCWKERGTEPSGVLVEGERYRAVRYLGRRREVQSRPLSWWKERGTEPFGVLVERERYRAVRCYRTPKGLVVNFIAYQHFIELIYIILKYCEVLYWWSLSGFRCNF